MNFVTAKVPFAPGGFVLDYQVSSQGFTLGRPAPAKLRLSYLKYLDGPLRLNVNVYFAIWSQLTRRCQSKLRSWLFFDRDI